MSKIISYRPEIDGLRALAVIPVMLFHADLTLFSGGYVGVDVFFVISGFLMTAIICRELLSEKFTYTGFYERRARRILPALYFMIFVSMILSLFILIPDDLIDFSQNAAGTVGFVSNLTLWSQVDYFNQAAELKPLLHTWSLAVEEQYYLVIPVLLILLIKFIRNHILLVTFILLALSLALSHIAVYVKPDAAYYLLPTRAWEMLIGSCIALSLYFPVKTELIERLRKYSHVLSLVGMALIVVPMLTYTKSTPFPGLWALPPTFGTMLIIVYAKPETLVHKFLSNKYMIGIGLISYSAYLWHQPIYAFTRHTVSSETNNMLIAFTVSLVLAYLSWLLIERPFRNRKLVSNKGIWIFSLVGAGCILLFTYLVHKNSGYPDRFELSSPLSEESFDLPKRSNGWCFYSVDTNSELEVGKQGLKCLIGNKQQATKMLLIGDSYAGMYEPFWDVVATQLGVSVNAVTTNWCHPSFSDSFWWANPTRALDQCLENRKYLKSSIHDYDAIILSAVWEVLAQKELLAEVFKLIDSLTNEHSRRVIIMAAPTRVTKTSVLRAVYRGGEIAISKNDIFLQKVNLQLKVFADNNENVLFLDREAMFSTSGNQDMTLTDDSIPYSWDGGHISIYGSQKSGENFVQKEAFQHLRTFLNF